MHFRTPMHKSKCIKKLLTKWGSRSRSEITNAVLSAFCTRR